MNIDETYTLESLAFACLNAISKAASRPKASTTQLSVYKFGYLVACTFSRSCIYGNCTCQQHQLWNDNVHILVKCTPEDEEIEGTTTVGRFCEAKTRALSPLSILRSPPTGGSNQTPTPSASPTRQRKLALKLEFESRKQGRSADLLCD